MSWGELEKSRTPMKETYARASPSDNRCSSRSDSSARSSLIPSNSYQSAPCATATCSPGPEDNSIPLVNMRRPCPEQQQAQIPCFQKLCSGISRYVEVRGGN